MEVARFEKRIFSYVIDLAISLACGIGLGSLLIIYAYLMPWYFKMVLIVMFCYIFFLLFNVPMLGFTKGFTFGSLIFGVKTVKDNGSNITFRIAWIKCLYLGLVPFVLANAIYMVAIHSELTAFDRITDSVSIDIRSKSE